MLTLQAAESAYSTAKILDEKGIAIVPKHGSLLAPLVSNTYVNHDPAVQGNEYHFDLGSMCARTDEPSGDIGYSEHAASMEETASFIAEKLQKHIFHTRTVVAPYVDAFAGQLAAAGELIAGNPDNGIEVVLHSQPGPLGEPSLVDSIKRNADAIYEKSHLFIQLPPADDNQVRQYMLTGAASVDASILEYFGKKEEGWLAARFKTVFSPDPYEPVNGQGVDAFIAGRENVDTALLVFLVSRRLWNVPPEGTNTPLAKYEEAMIALRTQAGLRLCIELDRLDRDEKTGVLIIGTENGTGNTSVIRVNTVVYKRFLKEGGSNETLFGCLLSPQKETRLDVILENKELYEATWERQLVKNKAYYDQKKFTSLTSAIEYEWINLATKASPEDFTLPQRAVALAIIKEEVRKLKPKDFDCLNSLALKLVCKARFYETDAYEILTSMQRAKEVNPGIDTREAANIAVTEHVCRWIASQFDVVAANKVSVFTAKDTVL